MADQGGAVSRDDTSQGCSTSGHRMVLFAVPPSRKESSMSLQNLCFVGLRATELIIASKFIVSCFITIFSPIISHTNS
jgi:hypothetical protein